MTDPTITDDYRAILRKILEDPADDLPRLVLADYLEENGGGDRAEFIREHVEYRYRHAGDVGLAVVSGRAGGSVVVAPATPGVAWAVDRGFVSGVTLTQTAFLGGDCDRCGGSGRLVIHHRTHGDCLACSGTGRTPGLAAAMFGAHPVTSVTLSDKTPHELRGQFSGDVLTYFAWTNGLSFAPRRPGAAAEVPPELFARLDAFVKTPAVAAYRTVADAHADLSRAGVAHGRDLVGLTASAAGVPARFGRG